MSSRSMGFAAGVLGALVCLPGSAAVAADTAADASAKDATDTTAEVVVTGSQVARPGFQSPTPITSVNTADLERVGATNVADALNQLPSIKPSVTPSSVGNLSKLAGGNYLDLRGLGYLRTLTLIDGKRYVPTTPEGVISTNLIPQALIGSVDVVTGGASAAYGSDAVAGVVNLKLDNALEGFRGSLQGGTTDHIDNNNYLLSAGWGAKFADGRGHVLIGGELAQNYGIADGHQRDWAGNRSLIVNPDFGVVPGAPNLIHVNDAKTAYAAPGGVITSGTLTGVQFLRGGTTAPFRYGTALTDGNTMNGGDGDELAAPYVLETPNRRRSGYIGVTYDVADAITAYGNVDYGYSGFSERSIPSDDTFTIQADNAYLPASLRQALTTAGETSFDFGRSLEDYGVGGIMQRARTWQGVAGARGKLIGSWTFDASFSYGSTRNLTLFTGDIIRANRLLALDAVVDPTTGGTVCRSTLTDPTNGCVPLNLFGVGSASQQAINYISGTSVRDWEQQQQVGDLTVRGSPFDLWAGPVSLAFGGEWRKLDVDVRSDPLSADPVVTRYRVGNTKPYSATEKVKEGFGEVVVPLAKDYNWAKSVELDIAGRVTDYETSGTVETWKAGLNYAPNDSFRLRATRSRDIRAPNINELFARGQTLFFTVTDTQINQTYSVSTVTGGNPGLQPEKADTFTGGLVFTPTFAPRLSASLDYYRIKVNGAIASLTAQAIVDRCNGGDAASCDLTPRGADGRISTILLAPVNFQQIVTDGLDLEMAYRQPAFDGAIDLHLLANYLRKLDLIGQNGSLTRFAGNTDQPVLDGPGGTPHWKAQAVAEYSNSVYKFSVTGRYVGGGVITRDDTTLDYNQVSGRFYVDLAGQYRVLETGRGELAVFAAIENLFDVDPPFTGYEFQTARQLYDVIGRQYTAGVRFRF
ncbi:MAG: TonB-dependent receptor [Proteobacteria bacterium]|nr:TonB-dependent receptor [Pseudomonadota bacterium]